MVSLDEGRFPTLELNNRRLSVKNSFCRKNGVYTRWVWEPASSSGRRDPGPVDPGPGDPGPGDPGPGAPGPGDPFPDAEVPAKDGNFYLESLKFN